VPVRVSPADRIGGHIDELFAQDRPLPEILEEVARLGAQLLMQAALEAEVTEFLGRDRYQRAAACDDARSGSRPVSSGHAPHPRSQPTAPPKLSGPPPKPLPQPLHSTPAAPGPRSVMRRAKRRTQGRPWKESVHEQ